MYSLMSMVKTNQLTAIPSVVSVTVGLGDFFMFLCYLVGSIELCGRASTCS
jgi:hypothetical protein